MNPSTLNPQLSTPQLAWLLRRRKRRRHANAGAPAAPVITGAITEFGGTEPGWLDVTITFTFDHGSFPVAFLEIWFAIAPADYTLLTTVPSTELSYRHAKAEEGLDPLLYKLRYVNGPTVGPFSAPFEVTPM